MKTRLALILLLLAAALVALAPTASAAPRQFSFGFADDRFGDNLLTNPNASVRSKWMQRAKGTGARYVRLNVYWSLVARNKPANPTNPADPAYEWDEVDRAVRSADAAGLEVLLMPLNAPTWAEGPGRPRGTDMRNGTWKPATGPLQQFARALARRYNGNFDPDGPLGPAAPLPQVSYYEAWNEPNLPNYLNPQWKGKKAASPAIYRGLLNAIYDGVKSVRSGNKVVTGGTSPFGDKPGGRRVRPIQFWREVFCLNGKLKRTCPHQAKFDIFGHNAINKPGDRPRATGRHKDDATPGNMKALAKVVRAAERAGTAPGPQHPLWSTETWYESFPERKNAFSLKGHAKVMQEAMYVLWKAGVENVIWLQIRDTPYRPSDGAMRTFQTGVYLSNDKPKPAAQALRFPFVVQQVGKKRKATYWGIAPSSGPGGAIAIEQKLGKRWRRVAKVNGVGRGQTFVKRGKIAKSKGRKATFRARQGKATSMAWNQKLRLKKRR